MNHQNVYPYMCSQPVNTVSYHHTGDSRQKHTGESRVVHIRVISLGGEHVHVCMHTNINLHTLVSTIEFNIAIRNEKIICWFLRDCKMEVTEKGIIDFIILYYGLDFVCSRRPALFFFFVNQMKIKPNRHAV